MTVECFVCGKEVKKSPSKIYKRPCCSRVCQVSLAKVDVLEVGFKTRITAKRSKELRSQSTQALKDKTTGDKHYSWKGEDVSYRGLHYWLRRKKGKPTKCTFCRRVSDKPKVIQWANIDGKYRRSLDDYFALCASCHKVYDLNQN